VVSNTDAELFKMLLDLLLMVGILIPDFHNRIVRRHFPWVSQHAPGFWSRPGGQTTLGRQD